MLEFAGEKFDLNTLFQFDTLKDLIIKLAQREKATNDKLEQIISINNLRIDPNAPLVFNPFPTKEYESNKDTKDNIDLQTAKNEGNNAGNEMQPLNVEDVPQDNKPETGGSETSDLGQKGKYQYDRMIYDRVRVLEDQMANLTDRLNQITGYKDLVNKVDTLSNLISSGLVNSEGKEEVKEEDNIINNQPSQPVDTSNLVNEDALKQLESKINKRFGIFDERLKKQQEENYALKKEIKSLNDMVDSLNTSYDARIKNLENLLSEAQKKHDADIANLENKLKTENEELLRQAMEKLESKIQEANSGKLGEEAIKKLEETIRKENISIYNEIRGIKERMDLVNSLDKRMRSLPNFNFIDQFAEDIKTLKKEMETKITEDDLTEMKNKIFNLDNSEAEINNFLQDLNQSNQNRNKEFKLFVSEFQDLKQRVSRVEYDLLNQAPTKQTSGGKIIQSDNSLINENIRKLQNDVIACQSDCGEFRRYFNEILPQMNKFATIKDLKNLEELMLSKLEEFRIKSNKIYADKIETQKSLKLLDTQIKHFIAEYLKKSEGHDTWMLAARPINAFKCASCETYLGDLNAKKSEYLPWNKYPTRDYVDKNYRMGDGFSRSLQNLNLEVIRNRENENYVEISISGDELNKEELRNHSDERKKRKVYLPKVKINNFDSNKYEEDKKGLEGNNQEFINANPESNNGPQIVKIKKINKS